MLVHKYIHIVRFFHENRHPVIYFLYINEMISTISTFAFLYLQVKVYKRFKSVG